jgi:bifunctional DNA-binding transcriptional regulator/antitoxin component of YhaV-PrlF toxin-antitoxin module
LPAQFRKALGLKAGDFVNAELENQRVELKPAKIIDAEDAWFFTEEWQKGEAGVDKDIATGNLAGPFSSAEEFIRDLEK